MVGAPMSPVWLIPEPSRNPDADAYHAGMRIGMLTGGGDCPGLNAVIRAVVLGGSATATRCVGYLDGWQGRARGPVPSPLDAERCRDILALGGTIMGTSRTNPFKVDGGPERVDGHPGRATGVDALVAIGGEDTLGVAQRLGRPGRRRRGRAQDHRQRPVGHRGDVRVRHRGADRHRGHRPPATTAESHQRVIVCEVMGRHVGWIATHAGHRRGRGRDPHARGALRARAGVRAAAAPPRRRPVLLDRGGGRGCDAREGPDAESARLALSGRDRPVRPRPPGRDRGLAGRARSSGGRGTRPGPRCSATSSGAAPPRPSTACWPPGSASPPSTAVHDGAFGTMVALRAGGEWSGSPWAMPSESPSRSTHSSTSMWPPSTSA